MGCFHHSTSETSTAYPLVHRRLVTHPGFLIFLVYQCADAGRPRRQWAYTTKGCHKRRRPRHPAVMASEIRHPVPLQMSVKGGKIVWPYSSLPLPAVG